MDECVAVAVAEAVAVAVTEAVAEADQSIHDQSIHDPPIQKQKQKQKHMDNRSKLDNQFSKSKKQFSESKKPCSPPFQIKNDLRRPNMKNGLCKKSSPKHVHTNVLDTF